MATAQKTKKQTASNRLHAKHASYILKRRRRRILVWAAAFVAATVIALQLAYPSGRGLPLANVVGHPLGLANHEAMAKVIADQFDATKLKLTVGQEKAVEYSLKTAGAEPNTEEMIKTLSDYPLWMRLIPGTILKPAEITIADVFYTNVPFRTFVEARSKELSFAPQNARLAIKDGRLALTDAKAGSEVMADELLSAISRAQLLLGKTTMIDVPAKRIPPARTAKDLVAVHDKAEAALAHTVTIQVGGRKFTPAKTEIASWIVLNTDKNGDVTLSVDKGKIKAFLSKLNEKVGKPAGQTNIMLVDGRETSRTTGATGQAIDKNTAANRIAAALLVPPQAVSVVAPMVDVRPSIIFDSKYTATRKGLQAYVEDVARTKNMHISIRQLDGEKWYAHARDTESIPSASTYKLFVALVLFDKMSRGEIHWNDPMLDTTVAGCFDRMTVASTNPCAESWIAQFGRQYINDFVHARGFSAGTTFTTGYATQTTAADLTKFMIGLNDSTLVSGVNRALLLDNLSRHPYRYGIPTGSRGRVNDKVGFLWDYVHDTAIVHHPRGTYVMTIMTKGQSYAAIAAVTREVERIMYP